MPDAIPCPLTVTQAVDRYFVPCRYQALDIAAFLDRVGRCADAGQAPEDFRVAAMQKAALILADKLPEKARRIQELFSDHSMAPIEKAHGKGACGAVDLAKVGGGAK